MQPVTYDFPPILQGSEWTVQLQFFQDAAQTLPLDLTDYEIDMQVRDKPAAALAPNIVTALSTRSDGDGANRITVISAVDGTVRLQLTPAETSAISWSDGVRAIPAIATYWYDIELVHTSGNVQRVMRGKWPFDAQITKQA